MIVTQELLNSSKVKGKGYTKDQVEYMIGITGARKWGKRLIGLDIPEKEWLKFVSLGSANKVKNKPTAINSVSTSNDGFWKPGPTDIPPLKISSSLKKTKKKSRKKKQSKWVNKDFYSSREWLELRFRALRWYGFACLACGSSREDGAELHVDHIKPRSKHPELSLIFSNLQVLCKECNLGKSNKYDDDLRNSLPPTKKQETAKMLQDLRAISRMLDKPSSIKAFHIFKSAMEECCSEEAEDLDSSHLASIREIHF